MRSRKIAIVGSIAALTFAATPVAAVAATTARRPRAPVAPSTPATRATSIARRTGEAQTGS